MRDKAAMVVVTCAPLIPIKLFPTVTAEAPAVNDGWAAIAVASAALPSLFYFSSMTFKFLFLDLIVFAICKVGTQFTQEWLVSKNANKACAWCAHATEVDSRARQVVGFS